MAKKYDGITIKSDEAYLADKAVRDFCKSHKRGLNESEAEMLHILLRNRAEAISNALGVDVHCICEE